MTARSVSDLAADVRAGFRKVLDPTGGCFLAELATLNELVARLEAAEAELERRLSRMAQLNENGRQAVEWAKREKSRREAAEAQVAALTHKLDEAITGRVDDVFGDAYQVMRNRAEAAEAALAALTRERNARLTLDEVEEMRLRMVAAAAALADTRRALEQIAANERWVQAGPLVDIARRALADTGGGTGQDIPHHEQPPRVYDSDLVDRGGFGGTGQE